MDKDIIALLIWCLFTLPIAIVALVQATKKRK